MNKPRITTQRELRREFWETFPTLKATRKFTYVGIRGVWYWPTDTRVAFVNWLDGLARDGEVSEALAQRATL